MPRTARGLADGFIYHVLNRGNGGQKVFHKEQDYKAFINLMKKGKDRHPLKILAYCLMPNHFHIVVLPTHGEDLSKWMQWLMTSHVRSYHKHYKTSGHVWQGRFKSFIVQEESYLLMLLRYVEGNPVRAGLVSSAKDWQWSSHQARIAGGLYKLIDEVPIALPQDWGSYVDKPLRDKELEKLRKSVNRQAPYGEEEWQRKICQQLGLESTIRPRGRPTIKKGIKKGTVPFFE